MLLLGLGMGEPKHVGGEGGQFARGINELRMVQKDARFSNPVVTNRISFIIFSAEKGKATVNIVGRSSDEGGAGRAEEADERGDLLSRSHAPDRLSGGEFGEHLSLAARVVLCEEAVNKRRVDAGRADAIAANLLVHEVSGYG